MQKAYAAKVIAEVKSFEEKAAGMVKKAADMGKQAPAL